MSNPHKNVPSSSETEWIQGVLESTTGDTRSQPWRQSYAHAVNNSFEVGPDYMTISSQGGTNVGSKKGLENSLAA